MRGVSAFLQCSFGRLYYETVGEGPTIVFAHGLGGNHLSWWQQVGHFAPRYRCITFAHRGFCPSDPLPALPQIVDFADDLGALLDACDVKDCVLVAQSMGGWTAVEYGLKNPHRVRALVMACTTGSIDFMRCNHPALGRLPRWNEQSAALTQQCADSAVSVACGLRMAREQPALHELYKQIDRLKIGFDSAAMLQRLWQSRTRRPDALAALSMPKLFISGAEDIVIPPAGVEAVAAAVGATFESVAEAGHSVYFERPDIFNARLTEFLNAL
ncbi:MAG: alpha/beta fold hydrolase [Beijerinckiaceae bacterium]